MDFPKCAQLFICISSIKPSKHLKILLNIRDIINYPLKIDNQKKNPGNYKKN